MLYAHTEQNTSHPSAPNLVMPVFMQRTLLLGMQRNITYSVKASVGACK